MLPEESADRVQRARDARIVDIEMRREPQARPASRRDQHAMRAQVVRQRALQTLRHRDENEVGMRAVDDEAGNRAQRGRERGGTPVVVGEALDMVVERMQAHRR